MACANLQLRHIGKRHTEYNRDLYIPIPCGYCSCCLKDLVNMWSDRCTFESMTTERPSAFITLTYNDDHLPHNDKGLPVVSSDDVAHFRMRLRKNLGRPYKYFFSTEYGEEDFRPHIHGMLFGFDYRNKHDFDALYNAWSPRGDEIGFFDVDSLIPSRIRYTLKYISKERDPEYSSDIEKRGLDPLFHRMSKGLGRDWFFQNLSTIQKLGGYYVKGVLRPLPRYYAKLLEVIQNDYSSESLEKKFDKWQRFFDGLGQSYSPFAPPFGRYDPEYFVNQTKLHENANKKMLLGVS